MNRQAVQALKVSADFARSDEIQRLMNTAHIVRLVLTKTKSVELLDKESVCCSLATD
jgi:hypothetical protein